MTLFRQGTNKVYLPNIIFRLVRSPNLQPNQAAFRVPPSCNKFDIHSYLTNIYGVNITEVRTMNYATAYKKGRTGKVAVSSTAYKKAIVTLDEVFTYPKDDTDFNLESKQLKVGAEIGQRKSKGWRIRPSAKAKTEKDDLAKLQEEMYEKEAKK
ncbi:ribosomal protein L23-domain-containing protein [Spinellus fusiger]|nr:ribosomal protein L23-domain-containing protein [Spinellus fusiger]